jgi:sugar lactone lactonase YvrE
MSGIVVRCVANPHCALGEGPLWDPGSRRLYWVDILAARIYRYDPADGSTVAWSTPEPVGFVFVEEDGDLVAGFKSGLHRVALDPDGTVGASRIDRVDGGRTDVRFNDATRDAQGRIWACTLGGSEHEPLGVYYRYDREYNRHAVDAGYLVANGPALSPDGKVLYTVETRGHPRRRKGVYASNITSTGELAEQRLLIDWAALDTQPDGLVTDDDGNLWIGEFHGNMLRCFDPEGEQTAAHPLPAWNVTKPVFGGENGDLVYVTSARVDVDEETLGRFPHTGGVLEISGVRSS